jgi:uncharacterized membrane protein YfcA
MMPATEFVGLFLAAMAGGAINAVAGGGTLVTFPALLAFGTPPVIANATSTLALVVGTFGGMFGYRRHLRAVQPWLWRFLPVSLVGGLVGSVLLTHTSNKTFARLVPFLILFATVLFLAQGAIKRSTAHPRQLSSDTSAGSIWAAIAFQFLVAIYGGYFGAGIGILMLAALGFMGLTQIHEMNTLKTVLGSVINLVAAAWFIAAGMVHWPKAGVMLAGALLGYYLGSHFSQRIPQQRVRQLITLIGLALSGVTFYQQFFR